MVEMQFGVNTYCQLLDAVSACDIQICNLIETEQIHPISRHEGTEGGGEV